MTTQTTQGYTPGPWKLSGWLVCRDKGIKYAIADVMTTAALSDTEKKANGRLIAAAPKMYELLLECMHDNRVPIKYAKEILEIKKEVENG